MSVISEGDLSLAVEAMRLCVAASKTFQEVSASDAEADALGKVLFAGEWETEVVDSARALVRQDQGLMLTSERYGRSFVGRIPFLCLLEIPIPKPYWGHFADELKWFSNRNGKILREILVECRRRPWEMPDIQSVEDTVKPGIYEPSEQQGNHVGVIEYRFEAVIAMALEEL